MPRFLSKHFFNVFPFGAADNRSDLPLKALAAAILTLQVPAVMAADTPELEEIIVEGRRIVLIGAARSASEGVVGQIDIETRPLLRPGDVLETIPGMIVTQHSGAGKSNQMFLRGFNLDHGTDFATWVDGMPVNMRTHGHGQGYTDINFIIPETIDSLRFVKGPYHAELGDFSSAGGTHISMIGHQLKPQLKLGLGENGFARVLAMGSADVGEISVSAALETQRYDGPWANVEEDADKLNGLVRIGADSDTQRWHVQAMYYDNDWHAADQIPARAVKQGIISELGSLDNTLGGNSRRSSLSAYYSSDSDNDSWRISAYAIDYRMQLWSNFSYFLDNPELGDQFEQFDDRTIFGGETQYHWLSNAQLRHRLGAQIRHDDIDTVGLYSSRARQRLSTVREDNVSESSVGVFYELEWQLSEQWKTVAGLRGDYYRFDVDSNNPANSGNTSDQIISPKLSVIYSISAQTEAYFSAGQGFHSNDARGTSITIDPANGEYIDKVDPLVKSDGAEIGIKTLWRDSINSSIALWYLSLDSELLFVGDAGNTEASRPSERWGVEINNFWTINPNWSLEADFAWTDTHFSDSAPEGSHIPGAIPFVASAALSANYPSGWFGSIRMRHFSSYPLIEDDSQQSGDAFITSIALGWRYQNFSVQLDALNIFDSNDHDIEYYYASRLPGEPADGVEDTHYKVFEPRQFRVYLGWSF